MNGVRRSLLVVVVGLVLLTGCAGGQADDKINFLRAKPSGAPDMTGITEGRLELVEGCLYIQSEDATSGHAAVWPFEFSLTEAGGSVQILDEEEGVVARVGDEIRVGGGEVRGFSPEDLEKNFVGNAAQCKSPYWVINTVVVISP